MVQIKKMLVQTAGPTRQFGEPFNMRNRQPLTFLIVGRVNPAELLTTNFYTLIKITFFIQCSLPMFLPILFKPPPSTQTAHYPAPNTISVHAYPNTVGLQAIPVSYKSHIKEIFKQGRDGTTLAVIINQFHISKSDTPIVDWLLFKEHHPLSPIQKFPCAHSTDSKMFDFVPKHGSTTDL